MPLFNRKNRSEDEGTVRLTSKDHAWWTGEEPDEEPAQTEAEAATQPVGQPPPPRPEDATVAGDTGGPHPDVVNALAEYGYGSLDGAGSPLSLGSEADEADEDEPGWDPGTTDPDLLLEVVESALFLVDGLPEDDHLADLLGTLGLEGEADWVDIARAHRRLSDTDHDEQRRLANVAYARLRLFHH